MKQVSEMISRMVREKGKPKGIWRSRWLVRRGGMVFTVTVQIGDKLNDPKNKEN